MKDPAFLFYPGDWLGGTMGMSFELKGAYMELLIYQFNNYHFSEANAKQVLSICFDLAWPMLKHKFDKEGEFYYQHRLRQEMERRKKFTESRRINGSKPKTKPDITEAYAKHMETETETETETEIDNKKGNGIDYDFIISNYHTLCPKMSKVITLTDKRKGFLNARIGEHGSEKLIEVFRLAGESEFLNGKNDKAWKSDFEWLIRPENFVKVMEGKYKNKQAGQVPLSA